MNRRGFMQVAAGGAITLPEFQPKSQLHVAEHPVAHARFSAIDIHTHLFGAGRTSTAEGLKRIAAWMDECNLETLINLTGGNSTNLAQLLQVMAPFGKRYLTGVEPQWKRVSEPGYASWQVAELEQCKSAGARCLKILKSLGLTVRENNRLLKVDDPRFDPMWEAAGALQLPVLIHTSDPSAFFEPIDRFNERYEELQNHPDWSFLGKDYPSKAELLAARNRVIARHPKTIFVGLHVANSPEDLGQVSGWLDRYPNLQVEIGARIGELGRQPRTARRFFERYQDRIMFGTDATPDAGKEYPQQDLRPEMYRCYFRFLETEDEYFDYAPSAVPPQGRWRIYGIGLPDGILRKVYRDNACRIFRL